MLNRRGFLGAIAALMAAPAAAVAKKLTPADKWMKLMEGASEEPGLTTPGNPLPNEWTNDAFRGCMEGGK